MTAGDLRSQLGPDLGALVTTVGVPLTALTEITGLPSEVLSRAIFRLVFADGRVVKGRRFGGAGGALYVGNETLACDACDFDLARTRYRWPMGAAAWAAFEQGYGAYRDLGAHRAHATWWAVAVLVEAALFRHRRARLPR